MTMLTMQRSLLVVSVVLTGLAGSRASAQEFVPPDRRPGQPAPQSAPGESPPQRASSAGEGFRVDILAFSTRAGAQVNRDGQAVLGSTVDLIQLGTPRLRARGVFEVGFARPETSLGADAEVVYRFVGDASPAIPYIGLGIGFYDDGAVRHGWPTVALGFELPFRRSFNWLVEYHALDSLRRSRFLVGLATRGTH